MLLIHKLEGMQKWSQIVLFVGHGVDGMFSRELIPMAAPSTRRRGPTAALVVPTPSLKASYPGSTPARVSVIPTAASASSHGFIQEAKT